MAIRIIPIDKPPAESEYYYSGVKSVMAKQSRRKLEENGNPA